jgi:signal transduction histidine kinase
MVRVRTKVIVGLLVFGLIVSSVSVFLVYMFQEISVENVNTRWVAAIQLGVANLSYCSNNYLMFENVSGVSRWDKEVSNISRFLASLDALNTEGQVLVNKVRADLVQVNQTFGEVKAQVTSLVLSQEGTEQAVLVNMILQIQVLAADTGGLSGAIQSQVQENHQHNFGLLGVLLIGVGGYFIGNYILVDHRTLRPLFFLNNQMKNKGKVVGNNVSNIKGEREIVDLVRSVNNLSVNLDKETTEKVQLQREILERKQIESELRKSKEQYVMKSMELTESNKELEAFSYSVAHDLKAPLRSINGFSHALFEDYYNTLDDQGKKHLDKIIHSSEWMAELINDLLQLSTITRKEIVVETVDLSDIAEHIIKDLRRTKPERRVEVHIEKGMVVHGDEKLLTVLIENLLDNAWKYTSKASHPVIVFGSSKKDESVYFVLDNGAGFDQAYSDKLFKPFERLHPIDEYPGTGVGLAIAQRIVFKHGGRIWAEGKVGEGARFYFSLPTPSESLKKSEEKRDPSHAYIQ